MINFLLRSLLVVPMLVSVAASQTREKPFYLRDIQIGDIKLPFTPVTVLTVLISFFFILRGTGLGSKSTVTASHILLDGDKAKDRLDAMKKEIKSDYNKFMALAKQHSKCPSKSAGGKLGSFRPGQMVPPFDKAVFDKENKVGTCIGPIQTNFGWHLIWIEDRTLDD